MSESDPHPPFEEVPESDDDLLAQCRVEVFRAGGPGGQHQNTSATGVRLVHLPTGLRVVAREERSQHRNRTVALARLRARLERELRTPTPRVPTRVPKAEKKRRLDEKKKRGRVKRLRQPPRDPE